jgi:selenocysteine-specific elongation factor
VAALTALAQPDVAPVMRALLATEGWIDLTRLALARNTAVATLLAAASGLPARRIGSEAAPVLLSDAAAAEVEALLTARLGRFHQDNPALPGPTRAALLAAVAGPSPDVTAAVLQALIERGAILSQDRTLALPGHRATLPHDDRLAWERIAPTLAEAGLRPPRVRELAEALGLDPDAADRLLGRLERFGLLIRVAPNRFFLPQTVMALGEIAEALAADAEAGGFTAAMFSQRSGIGRNLTIQVVEYLDRIGVTRRIGEYRHIRRPVAAVLG